MMRICLSAGFCIQTVVINGNDISVVLDHLNVFFKYSEKRDIFFRIDNLTT